MNKNLFISIATLREGACLVVGGGWCIKYNGNNYTVYRFNSFKTVLNTIAETYNYVGGNI